MSRLHPQRSRGLAWEAMITGTPAAPLAHVSETVRASWQRSRAAQVAPALPHAPLVLSPDALEEVRRDLGWVGVVETVLKSQVEQLRDTGHVLALFDTSGHMLVGVGNAASLAGLEEIHFKPGGLWSEAAVGTNGPGTALATGRATHITGAEHYCQTWHRWHCAAVPLREPGSHELFGVLDVSGPAEASSPQVLCLTTALAAAVEQAVGLLAQRHRAELLTRFVELLGRFPQQPVLLVDRLGRVISENAPARELPHPARLPAQVSHGQLELDPRHTLAWLNGARVLPLSGSDGVLGACVVLSPPSPRRAAAPHPTRYGFSDLIGESPALRRAVNLAKSCAENDLPVLVLGETGVGKEVLAQSIHAASARAAGPFVAINCAALVRELVESELFGYVGGAFSGAAATGHDGKFQAAHGGTVFLDEVGELSLPAQAALLRVLQEKELTPVGSAVPRRIDVRVLAATNRPLAPAVARGEFRADLYHRLNVVSIELPPLRERVEDLPELIAALTAQAHRETGRTLWLDDEVRAAFAQYAWPGNVRELQNLLRRLTALGGERPVHLDDLPADLKACAPSSGAPDGGQRERLVSAVRGSRNMTEAAARLGVTRSTLYRQMERFGLKPGRNVS